MKVNTNVANSTLQKRRRQDMENMLVADNSTHMRCEIWDTDKKIALGKHSEVMIRNVKMR